MTPYTKKIVELHKIHKAIENCNGGGGSDVTPTPEPTPTLSNIGFPFVPGKLIGYLDRTNWNTYNLDYSTNIVTITGDIIKPEDIEEYCISKQSSIYLVPILEYDETLDYNSPNYNNKTGSTEIRINYDSSTNKSGLYSISTYSQAYKAVKDGENYIIILASGD